MKYIDRFKFHMGNKDMWKAGVIMSTVFFIVNLIIGTGLVFSLVFFPVQLVFTCILSCLGYAISKEIKYVTFFAKKGDK